MDIETLRALFERLCMQLESDSDVFQLHYQGGLGLEFPQGVLMAFVFDHQVILCRFTVAPCEHCAEAEDQSLTADDCLDMIDCIRDWEGGFQEIFGEGM